MALTFGFIGQLSGVLNPRRACRVRMSHQIGGTPSDTRWRAARSISMPCQSVLWSHSAIKKLLRLQFVVFVEIHTHLQPLATRNPSHGRKTRVVKNRSLSKPVEAKSAEVCFNVRNLAPAV